MVRGLISERSYPWVVKPAGLNGWIRHRLSARFLRGLELIMAHTKRYSPETRDRAARMVLGPYTKRR